MRAKLEGLGAVFVSQDRTTPEYLGKFVQSEIEKWAKPIQGGGGVRGLKATNSPLME